MWKIKTTILAASTAILFILLGFSPAVAQPLCPQQLCEEESTLVASLMNQIETAAAQADSYNDFLQRLQNICSKNLGEKFPVLKEILGKLLDWSIKDRSASLFDFGLRYMLNRELRKHRDRNFFVISSGSYYRIRPWKDNDIRLLKQGPGSWHYTGKTKILSGRTLILERHPFGIKQRVLGPQIGLMLGFRGISIDVESRLTGMSYVFFIGRAARIRAFDITPFSR